MDPFIMLDYNSRYYFPPTGKPRGVGVHPHRGFETVSIAYRGRIAHHDSFGNSGVIGEGDVQWMTASSGLLHKEYHEKEFCTQGWRLPHGAAVGQPSGKIQDVPSQIPANHK
ncbi:MAG: pirin family protein [Marinilabiliales bacterium]|nr:pirin family protein [Marinilabiliales bacterium]